MLLLTFDIRNFSPESYNYAFEAMSEEKKQRIRRFRLESDRKRSVAGDMLARKLLSHLCGIDTFTIAYSQNGKPYLPALPLHISISHSSNISAVAVSEHVIGIDIQKIRHISQAVMRRLCSDSECSYIAKEPLRRSVELWTLKEAYSKATGNGIFSTDAKLVLADDNRLCLRAHGYHFRLYDLIPDFILSTCELIN